MLIIDAHLDLSWNALQGNRDLLRSAYTIRTQEVGTPGKGRAPRHRRISGYASRATRGIRCHPVCSLYRATFSPFGFCVARPVLWRCPRTVGLLSRFRT